jgi:hypothetical protein
MRKDTWMLSNRSTSTGAENQSELLNELERTLEWLCRSCPEQMRAEAAYEELVELRPRVEGATQALDLIKERRRLTEDEFAWRRVLRLLRNAQR